MTRHPDATPVRAAVALGSNLGDRAQALTDALTRIASLPQTTLLRASPFIETAPVRSTGAAGDLGGMYLNAAAILETSLAPRELLNELLRVERELGRVRDAANRSAPRTIDLDLLLYADRIINEPGLIVPHPRLHLRRFVLDPLARIAPDWIVPGIGASIASLFVSLPPDTPPTIKA